MSNRRFLLVTFTKPDTIEIEKLKDLFQAAPDWMRYAQNCWVLYTSLGVGQWMEKVRSVPGMETQNVLVSELDYRSATGYMPQWIWDWFEEKLKKS